MHRPPRAENPRLERLLDQRDHLRIQISLAEGAGDTHPDALGQMKQQLKALEQQIDREWGSPRA